MRRLVIGVAGEIAVGKTVFIAALAEALVARTTGFGDYVREVATSRGLAWTRDVLQPLGEQLKAELGDDAFVEAVLNRAGDGSVVIVDGVRHVEISETIRRLVAPARFVLMFLEVDEETRAIRAEHSRPLDAHRLAALAQHSTERQVHDGSLRRVADVILDSSKAVEAVVADAVSFVERLMPE